MEYTVGMKLKLLRPVTGFARDNDGLLQPVRVVRGTTVKVASLEGGVAFAYTMDDRIEMDLYPEDHVQVVR